MDRLANEKISGKHGSRTAMRPSASKLVTFDDRPQRTTTQTTWTSIQTKPKGSMNVSPAVQKTDSETSGSDDEPYPARTKPTMITEIQPSPRKNTPSTGVSALAAGSMRPATTSTTTTISTMVRPKSAIKKDESER